MNDGTTFDDLQAVKGWRITSDDYPGALCPVGDGSWRVAVALDGSRYTVQQRGQSDAGPVWVKSYRAATLAELIERHGGKVEGLAEVAGVLPDDPREAAPRVAEAVALLKDAFAATDWRRSDYGRVIVQDGNLRVVVTPCGTQYRLQWLPRDVFLQGPSDRWYTQAISCDAGDLLRYIEAYVWNTHDAEEWPCPRLVEVLQSLPGFASDGQWPALPARP